MPNGHGERAEKGSDTLHSISPGITTGSQSVPALVLGP